MLNLNHKTDQEHPLEFRFPAPAVGETLTPLVSSLESLVKPPTLAFPSIKTLAAPQVPFTLPAWLQDLIAARGGDLEAAVRLCGHISAPQGVSRDILSKSVMRVLSHAAFDLTVYLANGRHWRDSNDTPQRLAPAEWLPHEVLQWLKVEAVRAARSFQWGDGCYAPSIILSAVPDEYHPLPLGRPLSPEVAKGLGGRPRKFNSPDQVLAWLAPQVEEIIANGFNPSMEMVAAYKDCHENTIRKHVRPYWSIWEAVLADLAKKQF